MPYPIYDLYGQAIMPDGPYPISLKTANTTMPSVRWTDPYRSFGNEGGYGFYNPNWTYGSADPRISMPVLSNLRTTPGGSNPNIIDADVTDPKTGGIKGLFGGLRGKFGAGKALFGSPGFDLSALKNLGRDVRATRLFEGGPKLGTIGTAGMGAYQGIKAIQGLTENAQSDTEYNNLIRDIKSSAYSNPMVSQYLSADQNRLLRQARTGSLDAGNWGGAAQGAVQGVPQALLSALIGGVAGGIPGALIGGLGSLGNSAIKGYGNRTREQNDKLSGLYSALQNAEMDYRDESNQRIRNRHFNRMY